MGGAVEALRSWVRRQRGCGQQGREGLREEGEPSRVPGTGDAWRSRGSGAEGRAGRQSPAELLSRSLSFTFTVATVTQKPELTVEREEFTALEHPLDMTTACVELRS